MRKLIVFAVLVIIAVVGLVDTNKKDGVNKLSDEVNNTIALDADKLITKYNV